MKATKPTLFEALRHSMQDWRTTYPAVLGTQLRRHWLPIVLVALAALSVQAVLLTSPYEVGFFQDSKEYTNIAKDIWQTGIIFSPNRPPTYPLFLLVIANFVGWGDHQTVVWVQAVLMVIAAWELYFLAYIVSNRRWVATVVAVLIALNLPTTNMERSVLSEAVAYWAAITSFLIFARFLQTQRRRYLFGFATISVIAILERPAFLFLPLLLIALELLRAIRAQQTRQRWRYVLFCLIAIYGCVTLYLLGNKATNDYFGFTYISDVNLMGKIIEYRMWNDVSDPALQTMKADVADYMMKTSDSGSPWSFPGGYPDKGYDGHYYAQYGAFTHNIILHHPLEYLRRSRLDIIKTLTAPPDYLVSVASLNARWEHAWIKISVILLQAYLLITPLMVFLLFAVVVRPKRLDAFLLLCIALYSIVNVVLVAMTDYGAYYRLRSPMDWGPMFAIFIIVLVGGEAAVRALWQRRTQPVVSEDDELAVTAIRPPMKQQTS